MTTPVTKGKKVFVIHGRNSMAVSAMFQFLSSLGLVAQDFNAVRTSIPGTPMLWEVIEKAFSTAAAIVILMTPDEYVALHPMYANNESEQLGAWQARSNVLIEAGAAMIRDRNRTFLMKIGKTQWGSDFSGMRYEAIGNDADSRANFRSALSQVADVNLEPNTYLDPLRAGDFEACLASHDSVTPHSPFKPLVAVKSPDQQKVDDELRTLSKALTQLEQEWRTEVGAPQRNHDTAKFVAHKVGKVLSAHYSELKSLGVVVNQDVGDSLLSASKQLAEYRVVFDEDLRFWAWGDWLLQAARAFADDPTRSDLPEEPNVE